ncbi:MAG: aminopeptidase P family protein, partial [Rhodothermales bacterium]|nr:aminopeptidase P family protein [Rhodothermales bacterium]
MIDSSPFGARQSRFVEHLADDTLAVVSRGSDIRWLTGFTGSNGLLLIRPGASTLLTDGRYREQASREAFVMEVRIIHGDLIGAVSGVVDDDGAANSKPALRRVVFQADDLSFEQVVGLQQSLADHRPEFAAIGDTLSSLRSVKDGGELDTIGRALAISEGVMEEIHELLQPGVSERTVAAEIDYRHRLRGADGAAFDTIVAFGERAALPHARPGESLLAPGDCILIDFGCVVDGYRSDITRTMVLGEPPSGFIEAYRAVEKALLSAQDAVK